MRSPTAVGAIIPATMPKVFVIPSRNPAYLGRGSKNFLSEAERKNCHKKGEEQVLPVPSLICMNTA